MYFQEAIKDRDSVNRVLEKIDKCLKEHKANAVALTGMSGVSLASLIVHRFSVHVLLVRKGESTHSTRDVEASWGVGTPPAKLSILFVDDLISTGETFLRVEKALLLYGKIVGACLYNEDDFSYSREKLNSEYIDIGLRRR